MVERRSVATRAAARQFAAGRLDGTDVRYTRLVRRAQRLVRAVVVDQHSRHGLPTPPFSVCRVGFFSEGHGVAAHPVVTLGGRDGPVVRYHLNVGLARSWWTRVWTRSAAVVDDTFVMDVERWPGGLVACYLRFEPAVLWPTGGAGLEGCEAYAWLEGRRGAWHLGGRVIGAAAFTDTEFLTGVALSDLERTIASGHADPV